MSIQIKVSALKDRRFKAPITALFASDQLNSDGSLKKDELKFVGLFRTVPDEEIRAHLEKIEALRKDPKTTAAQVMIESREHIKSYFVGVEKHPSCDYPFLGDDGQPRESSPELVHELLAIKEIRDAVEDTYKNARDSDVLAKN
ncbi:hypothetical protein [uncultured Rheinheimera sp.]|jgi:predicted secreted protein|uniref:hypothetical protein n=1 Tax=uncultured Rheinheimera sp. TaxID=400532 RepID=UPI0025981E7E|nr:hypothetical protein [uncultured Rheinheimera sp.]